MPSIIDQQPFTEHVGNGVTTTFAYEYELLSAGDFKAFIDGALIPPSNYTLFGVGNQAGGTCTFNSPPAAGSAVLLVRDLELARNIDYQERGDLLADTVNLDFNRLWQVAQQLRSWIGSAIRAPFPEQFDPLPEADQRKGKFLAFDSVTGALTLVSAAVGSILDFALQLASAAGASLVGFIQAGAGAVLRTVQDKLRDQVSVDDFGGANDTLKLQAAITATPNGAKLNLRAKATYVVTKNAALFPAVYTAGDQPCLVVYQKQDIVIDGRGSTIRCDVHGQGIFDILESSGIRLQNVKLVGSSNFPPIDGTTGRAEKGVVGAGYYNASSVANGPNRNNSQNTAAFNTGGYGGNFPQFAGGTATTWGTWKGGGYLTNIGSGVFIGKGSTDITVFKVEASGFNEDGIQIDAPIVESYGWAAPSRVTVDKCYLHDNYNAGVDVHRCDILKVLHTDSHNNGHPNASIAHTDIDPGYGVATNNGTAPRYLQIEGGTFIGNKRKAIDAHSVDTAIIRGTTCLDSGYGIMLVNGSLGVIRNLIVADNLVGRIAYPVSAQGVGIYIERNAGGAAGFSGRVVVANNNVFEVGVPPGQTALYPGSNPAGIGIQLSGTLTGAAVNGNLIQNDTYLGFIGLCIGFAGTDTIKGSFNINTVRGGWANGLNNLASGGTNNSTIGNTVELTSIAPYAGVQTGMKGAADRFFSGNEITVPAGQNMVDTVFMNRELIVYVVMNGSGSTSWTMAPNQAKYLTSVASNTNGLQFNLAPGISSRAITFAQAASAKLVRTAGSVVIDHIYVRTEVGNTPAIGLQSAGSDNPSNNCTGSITFKILI